MKILAVIPARGGSKGIPRKNMRLLNGRPLISYAIDNALSSSYIDEVVVSTDSEEIISYASSRKVKTIERSNELAADSITLDPVIYDAINKIEKLENTCFDAVVTLQPTSPLLRTSSLDKALEEFMRKQLDTLISVTNKPHLSWTLAEDGITKVPAYKERLNRQQLPPNYLETGAFVISRRAVVSQNSRIGEKVGVFELEERESVDIDSSVDWAVSEALLKRKKIAFRLDGYKELGLGHVYRGLTLAYELTNHDVVFVCKAEHEEGIKKLTDSFMKVVTIDSELDFFDWLKKSNCDVVVVDTLDTSSEYISTLKALVKRVVSFEDLGQGAYLTDATINALYEDQGLPTNFYCGEKYVCLRDEFVISRPSVFHDEVKNVFAMFGGSDPLNLTQRIVDLGKRINSKELVFHFDIVLGPAYSAQIIDEKELSNFGIKIYRDVKRVSDLMGNADIAFTSQGRSVYELCQMAVPSIVIAQNRREQRHSFAEIKNGFINIGLGTKVSDEDIERTFNWLVSSNSIRRQMHDVMKTKNLQKGIGRVIDLILGDHYE